MRWLLLLCSFGVLSQTTLIKHDNIEQYNWSGVWSTASNTGYYTNASVSGTSSAVIVGSGNGTSVIEQNTYVLPNVTGLNPSYSYEFRFRLGSYFFSASTATTKGVDVADVIDVQVSINGGSSYVTELRIAGNNNAYWNYNTIGSITHTANGSFSSSAAPAGDVYSAATGNNTTLSTGYSVITLKLRPNISQAAMYLICKVNSAGEEWWIDNIELWEVKPIALPVELDYFKVYAKDDKNLITWRTISENICSHYILERSEDGDSWLDISTVNGSGTTTDPIEYSVNDYVFKEIINYYRLWQYDLDGNKRILSVIAIDNSDRKRYIVAVYDINGNIVDIDDDCIRIVLYSDGSSITIF